MLFDETETALSSARPWRYLSWRQQGHLAHIRTFVDHMATGAFHGCAIYYAVTEEFIYIAETNLEALSQRIERVRPPELDGSSNPRAIWVDIDELTDPGPQDPSFFAELGNRILDIGLEAGLRPSDARPVRDSLRQLGKEYASSITEGRVREFVKEAAARVAGRVASANTQGRPE